MTHAAARLGLVLVLALVGPGALAGAAERADPVTDLLPVILPITPAEARQLVDLLSAPDGLAVEVAEVGTGLDALLARLPEALVHDALDMPARHLGLLRALVADTVGLGGWLGGRPEPVFGRTIRALHRAQTLTTAAALLDRLTRPENRTIRLVVVLTARAHGVPMDAADLDVLRGAVLRAESGDLAPVVARAVTRLVQLYGRDGVRLLLTR